MHRRSKGRNSTAQVQLQQHSAPANGERPCGALRYKHCTPTEWRVFIAQPDFFCFAPRAAFCNLRIRSKTASADGSPLQKRVGRCNLLDLHAGRESQIVLALVTEEHRDIVNLAGANVHMPPGSDIQAAAESHRKGRFVSAVATAAASNIIVPEFRIII